MTVNDILDIQTNKWRKQGRSSTYISSRRWELKQKLTGRCANCGKSRGGNPYRCDICKAKSSVSTMPAIRRRAKEGRCVRCGGVKRDDMDKGYVNCLNCRLYRSV